jgi:hypothetical protein
LPRASQGTVGGGSLGPQRAAEGMLGLLVVLGLGGLAGVSAMPPLDAATEFQERVNNTLIVTVDETCYRLCMEGLGRSLADPDHGCTNVRVLRNIKTVTATCPKAVQDEAEMDAIRALPGVKNVTKDDMWHLPVQPDVGNGDLETRVNNTVIISLNATCDRQCMENLQVIHTHIENTRSLRSCCSTTDPQPAHHALRHPVFLTR